MSLVGKKYQYNGDSSLPPYEVVAEFSHNGEDRVVFLTQYNGYTTCSRDFLSKNWAEVKPELKVGDWFTFGSREIKRQVVGFWDGGIERHVIYRYAKNDDYLIWTLSKLTSLDNFEIL